MKFATVTHFYHLLKPFLCAEVPETSFFTTQIEGAIFYRRARRSAANCDESRRIAGVGPLKTTNTLQTGKEHSNTPQRAEGMVADSACAANLVPLEKHVVVDGTTMHCASLP